MRFGKTIRLFLIDGEANGRMTCELSNWSGKAYKIPRVNIKDCVDRADLTSTGVYLLFGKEDDGTDKVYIGEAESILKRLNQQLAQKDFWNEAIVLISKDENLNKAHIKYLESRLHEIATSTGRYVVDNSTVPTLSTISESDRAEMEEFIEHARLLVNTLGHKVFDEKIENRPQKVRQVFAINSVGGANAQGEQTPDGFVVTKGSAARGQFVPSIPDRFVVIRNGLINKGVLLEKGDHYEFTENHIFSSPSTAATIVMGRNANGLIEWKLADGRTLKDLEATGSEMPVVEQPEPTDSVGSVFVK